MLKNYFIVAWWNITRNKTFSLMANPVKCLRSE